MQIANYKSQIEWGGAMKFTKRIFVITFLIIAQASSAYAAEPIGKRIVLKKGMVLLLSEKHTIPMVTINMAIKAGSTAEPEDKAGLASITASLLMQGTKRRTASRISNENNFFRGTHL